MSQISITVNGFPCVSVRMLLPWIGLWLADAEVALTPNQLEAFAINGPAVLNIGGVAYPGTIDPLNSSSFADRLFLRIVGGNGGWNQITPPKQYYSQNGALLSSDVYKDTALAVGELPPVDPTPLTLGTDFERLATSAAQVFGDRAWYIDPTTGAATVAAWPSVTPDSTFTLEQFHPINNHIVGTCDVLMVPGTQITDPRLNGAAAVARTVEQFFTHQGSRVNVWCSANPVERLSEAFTIACRQAVSTAYLKVYQYRFVLTPSGSDLALQAVTPGAPDLNPVKQWQSLSGSLNKYAPSTIILVGFTADSPPLPYLVSTSPLATPLEIDLTAQTKIVADAPEVDVGPNGIVNLAGGANAVALANLVDSKFAAFATWVLTGVPGTGGSPPSGPAPTTPTAASKTKAT